MKSLRLFLFTCSIQLSLFAQINTSGSKIDPVLMNKYNSGKLADFVVLMKEQADVSKAYLLKTKEEKGEFVYQTLFNTAEKTQAPVLALLNAKGVMYERFWVSNAILVKSNDLNLMLQLEQRSDVGMLIENAHYTYHKPVNERQPETVNAIEWGLTKVKADAVWALGYKGQGVVIGGQDTGYEWTHPAIKPQYRGNNNGTVDHNYNWHDAIHNASAGNKCGSDAQAPCDDGSHGTHTMGTMAGYDGGANQIGMAPSAKWIGCRNMNGGVGTLASYIECFQWFIAPTNLSNTNPQPAKAPHVINNSWGCDAAEGCNSSNYATMEKVVDNVKAAGIVVVVSAGNDGSNCSTITTPAAIFKNSFTVGSTTSADAISGFSSRGPITVYGTGMMGPDISAPGSGIRSCVPGGGYQNMSGTSMAGPHVAGLVALIISSNPALAGNVDAIETIIKNTAVKLTSTQTCGNVAGSNIPNNTFGFGRINALDAINNAVTIGLRESMNMQLGVAVFPNPVNHTLSIEMSRPLEASYTLKLYTATGQLVFSEVWTPLLKVAHQFNIENLSSGIYTYSISNAEVNIQGKFIKLLE